MSYTCVKCKTMLGCLDNYGTDQEPLCYNCSDLGTKKENDDIDQKKIKSIERKMFILRVIQIFFIIGYIVNIWVQISISIENQWSDFYLWPHYIMIPPMIVLLFNIPIGKLDKKIEGIIETANIKEKITKV